MLAGYHGYFDDVAYGFLMDGSIAGYLKWRATCARLHARSVGPLWPFLKRAVPKDVRRSVKRAMGLGRDRKDLEPFLPVYPREFARVSPLRKKMWWDLTVHGLNELLRYADRNSMAHSREVRLPFLDHRLVEFAFSLPDERLLRNGWTKWILREAFPDLVPSAIRERLDKVAYQTPEQRWLNGRVWSDLMIEALHRPANGAFVADNHTRSAT
jgi:asparagine synthetase B (glutamine-hydrolysing)